jgi:protein-disulfide isomerase
MSKRFLIILAAIVVVFGGLLFFNKKDESGGKDGSNGNAKAALSEHKIEGSSGVVLTEYGDFQCPACGQYYPVVKQLEQDFKGVVTFQFRHLPLTQIHPNALIAARAAEAAGIQGKFFEMHDKLYESQQAWQSSTNPTPLFETYAKELGVDMTKFTADMKSEKTNDTVQADRADAQKKGYSSTPTFELNGKKIENPQKYGDFKKLLEDAVKAKQGDKQQ